MRGYRDNHDLSSLCRYCLEAACASGEFHRVEMMQSVWKCFDYCDNVLSKMHGPYVTIVNIVMIRRMLGRVARETLGIACGGSTGVDRAPQWDKGNNRAGWFGGQERIRSRSGPMEFRRSMGTRGRGIEKTGSLSEGYSPRKLEERKSRVRGFEVHRHGGLKRKPQKTIRNGKAQTDRGNCLPDNTPKQLDRRPDHIGGDD
ncbi:hypothetical protein Tco_0617668 [Tanacetum coccineum]